MIKNLTKIFLLFCFVFCSCKQQSKPNEEIIKQTKVVTKPLVKNNDSLLNSEGKGTLCDSIKTGVKIDINSIPKVWSKLTEYNGKKVIYKPCNSKAQQFTIYKTDGEWEASFSWIIDDDDVYKINCVLLENNDLTFYLQNPNDLNTTYYISIIDYNLTKNVHTIKYNNYSAEFVSENSGYKYDLYKELCYDWKYEREQMIFSEGIGPEEGEEGISISLEKIPHQWAYITYEENIIVDCNDNIDGYRIEKIDSTWYLLDILRGRIEKQEIFDARLIGGQINLHLDDESLKKLMILNYKPGIKKTFIGYPFDLIQTEYVNENGVDEYDVSILPCDE